MAAQETSDPRVVRLRSRRDARLRHRLFPNRARFRSAAAIPVSGRRRTRRTGREEARLRWLSNGPPEDAFGGEASERFGIANEFRARFSDVTPQPLIGFRDQLLRLGCRPLDQARAMRPRLRAKFLAKIGRMPPRLVQPLLDLPG